MLIVQVVPDYRGELGQADAQGNREGAMAALVESRKRARAWLARRADASWRVRKRHRVASHEALLDLENQLRVSADVTVFVWTCTQGERITIAIAI